MSESNYSKCDFYCNGVKIGTVETVEVKLEHGTDVEIYRPMFEGSGTIKLSPESSKALAKEVSRIIRRARFRRFKESIRPIHVALAVVIVAQLIVAYLQWSQLLGW